MTEKDFITISDALPTVRKMLGEGAVLLKNDNRVLPLAKSARIAVFGEAQRNAFDGRVSTLTKQRGYIPFGAGSSRAFGDGRMVAPIDALKEAEAQGLISIYAPLSEKYTEDKDYAPDGDMIRAARDNADTAVVFISRWVGECRDMAAEDWDLSAKELALLRGVCAEFDRVVAILNIGSPISIDWAKGEVEGINIDSLLFVGYGGMAGGYAVSDILTGLVNPSGKLSTTFAKALADYPSHGNYGGEEVRYAEDIYLGYRHFDTFAKDRVSYGFGYGLSYTEFSIAVESFSVDEERVSLKVAVKNIGKLPGKEVIQVYFSSPDRSRNGAALDSAAHELCAFAKTELLLPMQTAVVDLSFPISAMRRYDECGVTGYTSAYVLEAGEYGIFVGNSLEDASLRRAGALTVDKTRLVEQLARRFEPVEIKKAAEEDKSASSATVAEQGQRYDISVGCDSFSEIGAPTEDATPFATEFEGYLYDSKSAKWNPYSGTCLKNMGQKGAYCIFRFDAPKTGSYKLFLRMASSAYNGSYKLYYSDDNTNFSPLSISMSITNTAETAGGISRDYCFMDFACGTLKLREGENYLKLENVGSHAPNIALMSFAEIKDQAAKDESGDKVIPFAKVLDGSASLTDYIGQMTDYELAEFFVAYIGKLSSEAGGSDALCAKYGHRRMNMTDGPAGVREKASSWPCETIVASSWNIELVTEMGRIIGKETGQNQYDLLLAPGLNLHRYPLCGRNNEYYSEDPYLTGVLAAAMTRGVQSTGTGACLKHFICNEQEVNKLESNSLLSERALRQIYLYAFEIAIKESDPLAIMTSYNFVNGKPASASDDLLINVLRGEWGFDGMITGDWNNNKDMIAEINNGNGVRQPTAFCDIEAIYSAIDRGEISRPTLLAGAESLMRSICRMYKANLR